jgi:beta-lactamase regulating signal transducer with metallopeptidase domain
LLLTSVPFGLLFVRAVVRAGWSLFRAEGGPGTATVGLLKPWILFSPHLAKALDDRAIEAALEHERAHARHRDPLRVWLAQLATDLQWPWPQAQNRFRQWMHVLEFARDDEALRAGAEGSDLATAILASVRLRREAIHSPGACLTGEPSALKERIARLLAPPIERAEESPTGARVALSLLVSSVVVAIGFGAVFGERAMHALLSIAA